jgi:hypothetical protein
LRQIALQVLRQQRFAKALLAAEVVIKRPLGYARRRQDFGQAHTHKAFGGNQPLAAAQDVVFDGGCCSVVTGALCRH